MKKLGKVFSMILMITLLTTGCVKMDINMSINKDKSMDFILIEAFNQQLLQQAGAGDEVTFKEEDLEDARKQGFKVEEYKDSSMVGYKFSKEFKNIDDISTDEEITSDLNTTTKEGSDSKLFTVKKGIFKNVYSANFTSSESDEINEQTDEVTGTDTTTNPDSSLEGLEGFDYESLMSGMEMKFSVSVPYNALSNNATTVEDDGKTLIWDLMNLKNQDTMHFEFELYNMTNIYIAIAISGVILLGLITLVVAIIIRSSKNKKHLIN